MRHFPSTDGHSAVSRKAGLCACSCYMGRRTPLFEMPSFLPSSPSLYCWAHTSWCGISLWSAGVGLLSRLHPLPAACAPPACSLVGSVRKGFDAMWALLSNSWDIGVLPALFWSQMRNISTIWGKLTLSLPKAVQTSSSECCPSLIIALQNNLLTSFN